MGRRSRSRTLNAWINGLLVGQWIIPASGVMEFRYDSGWVTSPQGRPLSLSLPINFDGRPLKGAEVGYYFDNLLPDSEPIRRRLQTKFCTESQDAFDLLEAIGRDCVGAVQLLPENKTPEDVFTIQVEPLDDLQVEQRLISAVTPSGPLGRSLAAGDEDDFRISIAGAQEKTAFTWHDGRWCRPLGATPTTHIFKLPLGLVGARQADMHTSIENEWLCAQVLWAYGLPVANCEIRHFGAKKVLVVERFDRRLSGDGSYWLRLPQEDFCQALGRPSSAKYETDGGPGVIEICRLLATSETPTEDIGTFLRSQLIFWMLAATDGHAKNFSIHLLPQGRYRLTPLYDVLSVWPIVGGAPNQLDYKKLNLAMAMRGKNKHYDLASIQRRHFIETAKKCGFGDIAMEAAVADIIALTPKVIEEVGRKLPESFPLHVFDSIAAGLRQSARRLELPANVA